MSLIAKKMCYFYDVFNAYCVLKIDNILLNIIEESIMNKIGLMNNLMQIYKIY